MKFINTGKIIWVFLMIMILLPSCSFIEGVFKAGMGVGILLVVAVIAVVIYVISKLGRK